MKTIHRGEPKDRNIETEQMIYKHTLKGWIASEKARQKQD